MKRTIDDYSRLTHEEHEVLKLVTETAASNNVQVAGRLNAAGPTELARRLYGDERMNHRDPRAMTVTGLVLAKWIRGTGGVAEGKQTGRYVVAREYQEFAMASA